MSAATATAMGTIVDQHCSTVVAHIILNSYLFVFRSSLDRDEFLATIRKELRLPSHEVSDEDVEILFNALDVSGSGQLHLDQLYMLLGENGDKTSQENDGSGSRAGMVDASRVLSPRSQRQNQQRAASNSSKPHGDSPNASLSMSMLQSQNNGDRSLDINDSSRESKAKWEQRIQFLIKLYRMNVSAVMRNSPATLRTRPPTSPSFSRVILS